MTPPVRIEIKEPARVRPASRSASAFTPSAVATARSVRGVAMHGPRMLRPSEIDRVIKAARLRAPSHTVVTLAAGVRRAIGAPIRGGKPGAVHAESLPSNPSGSGTGMNPWWRYQTNAIPGGGRAMVNVGTGNLLLEVTDMNVAHKGVPLVLARAYNSQSRHDVAGDDGTAPGMYGNGWTNSFDVHLSGSSSSTLSVWDADGARYDYGGSDAAGWTSLTPGQHATLVWDTACGYLWTKKSGTTYYMFRPDASPSCPGFLPTYGGYSGRLSQIIGRNRNTYLTFYYSYDGGVMTAAGKISGIAVQAESGLTASLSFADFAGNRLLQQVTFPDGVTSVSYAYDAQGNLSTVAWPANNAAGVRPTQIFAAQSIGADRIVSYVGSPRFSGACNTSAGCYSDGGGLVFKFAGTSAATSTVSAVQSWANVNPSISDGATTAGPIQGSQYASNVHAYNIASYVTGVTTPTMRDNAAHMVNWVVDGSGRPTQTQVCTAAPSQGACPTQSWLVTNESWDANNNETDVVSARGGTTHMVYDSAGNVVAIARPPQYYGHNPPTTLIDYDSFNNVTAVCDPVIVTSITADYWSGQYAAGADNYCSSQFGTANHAYAQYTYPSYEPYGELASITSATGYTRSITYAAGPQGGADYGLPTNVAGTSIQQFDGSSRLPSASASYDANGNLTCVQSDASTPGLTATATTVMTYDLLNRMLASADPDDASLTGSCSTKAAGIPGSAIVTTQTYFPNGAIATTRTPSEAALNYNTSYTYDLDGNLTAEVPNYPSPQTARVKQWYDGMDRLIETQQPADPGTPGDIPISSRYFYDLSQGGSATTLAGAAITAHGNLYDVVKNTPTGWTDFSYSAFDSADRVTAAYAFAPCPAQLGPPAPTGAIYCAESAYSTRYDWDSSSLNPGVSAPGLLVATLDAMGATRMMTYDGLNLNDTVNYADGTVGHTYYHDLDGRLAQADEIGFGYNADGTISGKSIGDGGCCGTDLQYSYYPDSLPASLSATTSRNSTGDTVNQPNLFSYAYRNDGRLTGEAFGVSGQSVGWTYTRGGRMTAMNDFNSTPSLTAQYADGHGRLSSYVTPSGTYGSFIYDDQGRPIQYTDPYSRLDGETVNSTYNIRGDLVARTFSGGAAASKPGFQYKNIQGVLVQNPADQYDGRTGAALVTHDSGTFQYDQIGRLTSGGGTFTYDDESRLTSGDTWNASSAGDADCHSGGAVAPGFPPPPERSYYYDGLGQVAQDTLQSGGSRRWVWNGAAPLYVMPVTYAYNGASGPGAPNGFAADGVGFLTPDGSAPGLTISDTDFDGAVTQYHNNTGHSTWAASNPYNQFCQHANPIPASANYGVFVNTVPSDSSSDRGLTVMSTGRAYLSRSMGFTTPDYSSMTPYASSRRGTRDYCLYNPATKHWDLVKSAFGHINDCAQNTPQDPWLQVGSTGDPFGFKAPQIQFRPPDFTQAQICGGPRLIGTCAQLTLDKCGRFYVSPPFTNVNVGKNPGFISSSFTTGWVGAQPQSPAAMAGVLSQGSWSVTAGFKAGITAGGNISFALTNPAPMFMTTMLVPTSVTGINNASVGPMTPQVGAMLGYNFGPFSLPNSGGTC